MKAIILAAGLGSRLAQRNHGRPKALIPVGGRSLIAHQIEALSAEGVSPVVVVVGHAADTVRAALGDSVEYVVNERPGETNSLYSLWLARDWLEGDVLVLNSDLLFHPDILRRVLAAPGSALAYDSTSHGGAEQTKVGMVGSRVVDLGKDFPETGARGENLGLIKLDRAGSAALRTRAEAIIAAGDEKVWATEAVRSLLADVPVTGVNVAGLPWVEIDFPYDLERARREVWPEIERDTQPAGRLWRRLRVPTFVGAGLASVLVVWTLSAQVGPASLDWESLAPEQGRPVRIQRVDKGSQKWWLLDRGEKLRVRVDGAAPVRLEIRPLMQNVADTAAYVIATTLDGEPFRFEARRAASDPDVALDGWTVGKRDREVYQLPPGEHLLELEVLAGTPSALLMRVRQPE